MKPVKKERTKYQITGEVTVGGWATTIKDLLIKGRIAENDTEISAYSPIQAKKLFAERLARRLGGDKVYVGNAKIFSESPRFHKEKFIKTEFEGERGDSWMHRR